MVMNIPIQNIYYLLCYAWNKLEEKDIVSVSQTDKDKIVDLFGKVLCSGIAHLLKRGPDRGYVLHKEETGQIKGKINFAITLRKNFFSQPRVYCEYDELNHNILHNRILKSTVKMLLRYEDLDENLREQLKYFYHRFQEIEEIDLSKRCFRLIQFNRNNYFYDFLLKICELLMDNLLIDEKSGKSKFRDFLRDNRSMSSLFEEFVRNFYKREQNNYRVSRENIPWDAIAVDEASRSVLPNMQTDISLTSQSRKIIIDTKYYAEALQKFYDKESIRSSNLYQLFTYLMNLEALGEENEKCEGILLYPTVQSEHDYQFIMKGHKITVRTINLNQNWKQIEKDLLALIN
jgi:5-methylcytosine-specific restriction enzyme subunit McrC